MDTEVLANIIGRRIPPSLRRSAVVHGYRRVYRAGAWYPILVPDAERCVDGVLVTALAAPDAARLSAFEGNEYELVEVPVMPLRGDATVAKIFLPAAGVPGSSREWTFYEWRRRYRAEYLRRTRTSCPRGSNWI